MDLLKRSSSYRAYLERIKEYQEISDKNEAFTSIHTRVEFLLSSLRNKANKRYYSTIHQVIIGLSLLAGILCFYKGLVFFGIVNVLLAFASKYYYGHVLKPYINHAKLEQFKMQESQAFESQLYHSILYAQDGIDIKLARISAVRNTYIVQFAFIMVSAIGYFNMSPTISYFVLGGISGIMSIVFWFYFFKDEIDELEYQRMELERYEEDFEASRSNVEAVVRPIHEVSAVFDLDIGEIKSSTKFSKHSSGDSSNEHGEQLQLEI